MVSDLDTHKHCEWAGVCGGCPTPNFGPVSRRQERLWADMMDQMPSVVLDSDLAPVWAELPSRRLRDRADLVWAEITGKMTLGLYEVDHRENIIGFERCPMMSEALESWFLEFRTKTPPIRRGSVRLRVAPDGTRGVWLDFANIDVKGLFEQRTYLKWLSDRARVEIGQRRKFLVWKNEGPKLVDPEYYPWFVTFDERGRPIPLYGVVGGFSQVGFRANRALVDEVLKLCRQSGIENWMDLFCGSGNFAFALAASGFQVMALESDPLSVQALQTTLGKHPEFQDKLTFERSDLYKNNEQNRYVDNFGWVVDPPRPGLRQLIESLSSGAKPQVIVYVSCFSRSLSEDTRQLLKCGYQLEALAGVDQFPHSPHCEWVGWFRLK